MSDALDALAPAAVPSAPAPAAPSPAAPATAAPSAAPPSAAPAVAAPTTAATAAPALDGPALLQALSQQLGIPADELRASLDLTRRMRAEHERRQQIEQRNDPQYQQRQQRGEAFRQLVAEGYDPSVADALPALPEMAQFLSQQRAEGAHRDMVEALGDLGIRDDGSKGSAELLSDIEDRIAFRLNQQTHDGLRLNRLYHGTAAERRACVNELVAGEERYLDRHLLRHNAATLRDHAARQAATPRGGRSVVATPQVRAQKSTAANPLQRTRENRVLDSKTLDDIFAHHN